MSINLNIEKYGGKSVVPVTCGSSTGTAFYIGERRFLTAWHVVAEAETPGESISLLIEGETKYCRLDKLEDMDAALLTCTSDIPDITPIELLKTDFRDDEFEIIGYPQELGNGIDYFGVSVKNLKELSNHDRGFDVMVMRTDPFGFHSYSLVKLQYLNFIDKFFIFDTADIFSHTIAHFATGVACNRVMFTPFHSFYPVSVKFQSLIII